MKNLVLFLVKSIVDNPKDVSVSEEKTDLGYTNIIVSLNKEDMGKVIGKQGKIIRAIRTLIKIPSIKENQRFNLQLTTK